MGRKTSKLVPRRVTVTLSLNVSYEPSKGTAEEVAETLDHLLMTALSTPYITEMVGDLAIDEFQVSIPPDQEGE